MPRKYTLPENVIRKDRVLGNYDRLLAPHGQRIDYIDYTSIDWFHDFLQYRAYLRMPANSWISWLWREMQVWVLLFILGVAVGTIQVFLSYSAIYLGDLKAGYCTTNVLFHRSKCCKYLLSDCESWVQWSTLKFFKSLDPFLVDFVIYFTFSLLFGFLAVALTLEFAYKQPANHNHDSDEKQEIVLPYGANSGLPEIKTILSGFIIRGYLGTRTLLVKIFGVLFAVASGLIVSFQGPLIHISCCIGNILSRFSDKYSTNEGKKRELLSCAAAVGVSAAFGSPIGGVLFSLEETSYYFPSKTMIRSYFSAMVAALTVSVINLNHNRLVLFQVTQIHNWHAVELIPYALLGLFGGLFGVVFNDCVLYFAKLRQIHLQRFPIYEVLAITTITSLLSFHTNITQLSIPALLTELFTSCTKGRENDLLCNKESGQMLYLGYTFIIKTFLIGITTGIKVPGGTFLPTMMVGGLMGRLVGNIFEHLFTHSNVFSLCQPGEECIVNSAYALIGAAAALSGVTRLTVSSVVIFYELTGNMHFVIPIMISTLIATWTANFFNKCSLIERQIEFHHLPYLNPKLIENQFDHLPRRRPHIYVPLINNSFLSPVLPIEGEMQRNVVDVELSQSKSFFINQVMDVPINTISVLDANTTRSLIVLIQENDEMGLADTGFPILINEKLGGFIDANELLFGLKSVKEHGLQVPCYFLEEQIEKIKILDAASELINYNDFTVFVNYAPITISPKASQDFVIQLFSKLGIRYVCVVDINGKFIGTIHKKRIVSYISAHARTN